MGKDLRSKKKLRIPDNNSSRASNFLSLIRKSTRDYELKKKIRKSNMSVEAITDAIHEYMYEKLNESPETEDEKKIRYVDKRK